MVGSFKPGRSHTITPHLPPFEISLCLQAANELQRSGHEAFVLEDIDFGRCVPGGWLCGWPICCIIFEDTVLGKPERHGLHCRVCGALFGLLRGLAVCVLGQACSAHSVQRQARMGMLWALTRQHAHLILFRRLAVEKELSTAETAPPPNALFDESGNFLL